MPVCPCNKVAYARKAEAKAAKRSCQQRAAEGATWRNESRVYRCPDGGGWHLTSGPHHVWDAEEAKR